MITASTLLQKAVNDLSKKTCSTRGTELALYQEWTLPPCLAEAMEASPSAPWGRPPSFVSLDWNNFSPLGGCIFCPPDTPLALVIHSLKDLLQMSLPSPPLTPQTKRSPQSNHRATSPSVCTPRNATCIHLRVRSKSHLRMRTQVHAAGSKSAALRDSPTGKTAAGKGWYSASLCGRSWGLRRRHSHGHFPL